MGFHDMLSLAFALTCPRESESPGDADRPTESATCYTSSVGPPPQVSSQWTHLKCLQLTASSCLAVQLPFINPAHSA